LNRLLPPKAVSTPLLVWRKTPCQALDDLMAAVEILFPVWPPREAFPVGSNLLL
jgi:hypothetical protein